MMRLIRYAGFDEDDHEYDEKYRRRTAVKALQMFRVQKMDTLEIARKFHAREATIVRWIDSERNREYRERG